jgi:hypothetical protein
MTHSVLSLAVPAPMRWQPLTDAHNGLSTRDSLGKGGCVWGRIMGVPPPGLSQPHQCSMGAKPLLDKMS